MPTVTNYMSCSALGNFEHGQDGGGENYFQGFDGATWQKPSEQTDMWMGDKICGDTQDLDSSETDICRGYRLETE